LLTALSMTEQQVPRRRASSPPLVQQQAEPQPTRADRHRVKPLPDGGEMIIYDNFTRN